MVCTNSVVWQIEMVIECSVVPTHQLIATTVVYPEVGVAMDVESRQLFRDPAGLFCENRSPHALGVLLTCRSNQASSFQ